MKNFKNISYHDSTILDIKKVGSNIIINLDDVQTDECKSKVEITCSGVKKILVNNNEDKSNLVYAEEGEVWDLELFGSSLNLIVDWHDFIKKKCVIVSYRIYFENIDVKIK